MTDKSIRDQIRAATIGAKSEFKTELVDWNGVEVEIRQPTHKSRKELFNKCKDKDGNLDATEFLVWSVIRNTYIPKTNETVFEAADYDALVEKPAGGFLDKFGEVAVRLFNPEGKN